MQIGHPCMADVVDYLYANNYMSETDYTLAEFQERLYVAGASRIPLSSSDLDIRASLMMLSF